MGLTKDLGALPRVITVANTNFVGVNNTNPIYNFDISGGSSSTFLRVARDTGYAMLGAGLGFSAVYSRDNLNAPRNFIIDAANVGIGTESPNFAKLSVSSGNAGGVRIDTNASYPALTIGGTGSLSIDAPGISGGRFSVRDNGNVLIGTTTDSGFKLNVNGSISATSLSLSGNYEAAVNTDSSWASYQTLIPIGTFPAFGTYIISVWWHYGNGSNQPYYYNCAFLWVTSSTNGNGTDVETTPIGATHTGGTGVNISFRSIAGVGSSSGLQARLNNFPNANGFITVRATRMQGF